MKKRLFSILLALCMVLCLVPTTAFAESETEETPVCTCKTACTAEAMNAEGQPYMGHFKKRHLLSGNSRK